jgi:hypothetical protein
MATKFLVSVFTGKGRLGLHGIPANVSACVFNIAEVKEISHDTSP